ncbi:MAG TPA: hypothetical protein VLF62_04595 [Candidatus Saccharimonadales bacterium]|nr:hypothetical protein [Candidatus Saccharimonadales bacterium]
MGESYVPPLHGPLREAEHAIGKMVVAPGAEWGMNTYDWAVGVNAAASADAAGHPDVIVSQALGPKPAEQPAQFTARTPHGALKWTEGATDLKDLKHSDGRTWTDLTLAKKALGSVTSAQVVEPSSKKAA